MDKRNDDDTLPEPRKPVMMVAGMRLSGGITVETSSESSVVWGGDEVDDERRVSLWWLLLRKIVEIGDEFNGWKWIVLLIFVLVERRVVKGLGLR